jgi:hypothetical protein
MTQIFFLNFLAHGVTIGLVSVAGSYGEHKSGWDWNSHVGHLAQVGTFSTKIEFHIGITFFEIVDVFTEIEEFSLSEEVSKEAVVGLLANHFHTVTQSTFHCY